MTTNNYYLEIKGVNHYLLQLALYKGCLQSVSFIENNSLADQAKISTPSATTSAIAYTSADQKIISQFQAYFAQPEINWDINFDWPKRTDFQCKVLNYLTTIPLASTISYGQLAKHLDTSPRAVGNACRCNPFPIIIPCHRVVAKNDLGGYDGDRNSQKDDISGRLAIKYFLLKHERAL